MNDNQTKVVAGQIADHLDQLSADWSRKAKEIEKEEEMPHLSLRWNEAIMNAETYSKAAALIREQLV